MYRVRIPIATAIFAVLFGVCWLSMHFTSRLPVLALMALFVIGGLHEFTGMAGVRERWLRWLAMLGGAGFLLASTPELRQHLPYWWDAELAATGLLVSVLVGGMLWGSDPPAADATARPFPHTMVSVAFVALGVAYVCVPMLYLVKLYVGHDYWPVLAYVIVVSKSADMGGFLVGKAFGKHKLIPRVSPKKSWEGTAGGVALSVLMGMALPTWFDVSWDAWSWQGGAFGAVMAPLSLAGDLVESYFKRWSGQKDSGNLIPAFGGVLDLTDSLTFCVPVAYYLLF